MIFRKVLALRGPNIWANSPVLEAWLDLQDLKDSPSNTIPGFNDRLKSWLPSLIEHECSEGRRGGCVERLDEGTWPGHILEHVALELQTLAGTPVGFGRTRETAEEGVYKVVVKYREEELARACLETARTLILAAVENTPFDIDAEIRRLRDLAREVCLGPSTMVLVEAAKSRCIPVTRIDRSGSRNFVLLGHGVKQRRILASKTDRTSTIAVSISDDKEMTKGFLRRIGVPVPEGRPVQDAEDAWEAAQEVDLPVVVKPRDADYAHGVSLDLKTKEQVLEAYSEARQYSSNVIVERFARGFEYRILVVEGRAIAAIRRDPAHVVGDGRSTVAQLVDEVNRDPRRGDDYRAFPLRKVRLDSIALGVLRDQGYELDSVPLEGTRVLLRRNSHRLGGTNTDVTDLIHPEVAARAIEATRVIGLDIAGLDVVAEDISRPLEAQGGVIVEVNAEPNLRIHVEPSSGTARPVGEAIINSMFPEGEDGRIPLVAVTGVNGKTTTTRLIAHILRQTGKCVGMTCTDGIYLDGRRIEDGDCAGPKSARSVLLNPKVEAAVFETARGGILREGLGFDRCHVAVVTNIGEGDHLGLADIHTLEKLALVKRTPVDVVLPEGTAVLNGADPLVAAMAPKCRGSVTFFALDEACQVLVEHRAGGGRVAFTRDHAVILAEGPREEVLIGLEQVPLTMHGRVKFQVENTLAASAAAWALGVPFEALRAALGSFVSDMEQVPGRFNILHVGGATVIVDFGHNPSALLALVDSLGQLPHERRSVVFSADGDRGDDAILRQAEIIGNAFDHVILYEQDVRMRGRADGAIFALLRRGLALGGRVSAVIEAQGEFGAIRDALESVQPGDLLLILHDAVEASLAYIQNYLASHARRRDSEGAEVPDDRHGRGHLAAQSVQGE